MYSRITYSILELWAALLPDSGGAWLCQNTAEVVRMLQRLNAAAVPMPSTLDHIMEAYDFTRLYTNITHPRLIQRLGELVERVMQRKNATGVIVTYKPPPPPVPGLNSSKGYFSAAWSQCMQQEDAGIRHLADGTTEYWICRHHVPILLSVLIKTAFIQFGPILVRQDCGIPMGISPAPFFANLFLASFELDFLTQQVPTAEALTEARTSMLAKADEQFPAVLQAALRPAFTIARIAALAKLQEPVPPVAAATADSTMTALLAQAPPASAVQQPPSQPPPLSAVLPPGTPAAYSPLASAFLQALQTPAQAQLQPHLFNLLQVAAAQVLTGYSHEAARQQLQNVLHALFDQAMQLASDAAATLAQFQYVQRYLDDLLAAVAPLMQHLLYDNQRRGWLTGLYPGDGSLSVLQQPHTDQNRLPFMDLLIITAPTEAGTLRVTVTLYDKLMEKNFVGLHISRYVPSSTNVDPMHTQHIFTSQLSRFAIVCSQVQDFLVAAGVCMGRLWFGGHTRHALHKRFKRFCAANSHVYYPLDTTRNWVGTVLSVAQQEFSRLQQLQQQGAGTVGRS